MRICKLRWLQTSSTGRIPYHHGPPEPTVSAAACFVAEHSRPAGRSREDSNELISCCTPPISICLEIHQPKAGTSIVHRITPSIKYSLFSSPEPYEATNPPFPPLAPSQTPRGHTSVDPPKKPHLMASATLATAFSGLWVAIGAVGLYSVLDQPGTVNLAQAPPVGAAVQLVLLVAAFGIFNTAITLIYVHLHNGRGGAGNGRIPGVVSFILCASTGVLQRLQPGTMDGVAQAPLLGAAAVHVFLPASATVTFFLSVTIIYVHVCTVGGAGADARNGLTPAAAKLLTKMALAVAFVTVVLSLVAAIIAFYTK